MTIESFERERTRFEIIYYAVYLVFLGLSFESAADAIETFVKRSSTAVWDWYQELGQDKGFLNLFRLGGRRRVKIFAVDETGIRIGKVTSIPFPSLRTL